MAVHCQQYPLHCARTRDGFLQDVSPAPGRALSVRVGYGGIIWQCCRDGSGRMSAQSEGDYFWSPSARIFVWLPPGYRVCEGPGKHNLPRMETVVLVWSMPTGSHHCISTLSSGNDAVYRA